MDTVSTGAVVLAAGGGTRFAGGGHKLLAGFRGRPLVAWAVEAAVRSGIGEVAVVTGAVDLSSLLPDGVVELRNDRWAAGQATSLQVALDWARRRGFDAIVVGLGDQPGVTAEAWRRVAASPAAVAAATYGGERRNPVRLAAEVWPLLPAAGDAGARAVFDSVPGGVAEVACPGEPADVDTVEDLEAWT